jgi:hypothetical protein
MTGVSKDVTLLLKELRGGNEDAVAKLVPLLYSELRRMAAAYLRRERRDHTLQPTGVRAGTAIASRPAIQSRTIPGISSHSGGGQSRIGQRPNNP